MYNKEASLKYNSKNREKRRAYNKIYKAANPEIILAYRVKNRDKILEYAKKYYIDNAEKRKQYYEKNKERIKKGVKANYENNKERYLEYQKKYRKPYYIKNKETMNAKSRAYAKTERGKITVALAAHKRRQILKNSSDKTIDIDFINNLIIIQKGECKGCKVKLLKNGKKNYHIDHIIPISKGGYHTAKNIQLLCPTCNHIKYDKVLEDTFFKG